jgi:hypothetical protein
MRIPGPYLVKGQGYDKQAKYCVKVVLRRTGIAVLGLDPMYKRTQRYLPEVQGEYSHTPFLFHINQGDQTKGQKANFTLWTSLR